MCLKRKDIANLQCGGTAWPSRCITYCVCQALGPAKKNWRKQSHGKENLEESKEARSHQAVDDCFRSLKVKSGCKFFINETIRHTKTGGNKTMAKKILKKAKKLEATKPLTVAAGLR